MFGDGTFGEFAFAEPRATVVPVVPVTPGAGGQPVRERFVGAEVVVRDDEEVLIVLSTII